MSLNDRFSFDHGSSDHVGWMLIVKALASLGRRDELHEAMDKMPDTVGLDVCLECLRETMNAGYHQVRAIVDALKPRCASKG